MIRTNPFPFARWITFPHSSSLHPPNLFYSWMACGKHPIQAPARRKIPQPVVWTAFAQPHSKPAKEDQIDQAPCHPFAALALLMSGTIGWVDSSAPSEAHHRNPIPPDAKSVIAYILLVSEEFAPQSMRT